MGKFALILVASFTFVFATVKNDLNKISEDVVDTFADHYEQVATRVTAASAANIALGELTNDDTFTGEGYSNISLNAGTFSIGVADSTVVVTLSSNQNLITATAITVGDTSSSSVTADKKSILPVISASVSVNASIAGFFDDDEDGDGDGDDDDEESVDFPGINFASSSDSSALILKGNAEVNGSASMAVVASFPDLEELMDKIKDLEFYDEYLTDTSISGFKRYGSMPSDPEITYLEPSDGSVSLSGNVEGAGLLIVDAEELDLSGQFSWEGVVMIVGENVDVKMSGQSYIPRAFMLEADSATIKISGNAQIMYDEEAITNTKNNLPRKYYYAVNSWREH